MNFKVGDKVKQINFPNTIWKVIRVDVNNDKGFEYFLQDIRSRDTIWGDDDICKPLTPLEQLL